MVRNYRPEIVGDWGLTGRYGQTADALQEMVRTQMLQEMPKTADTIGGGQGWQARSGRWPEW